MRTLRAALADTVSAADRRRIFLFRPGGFGKPAVWLSAEEIARFHALLAGAEEEPRRAAV